MFKYGETREGDVPHSLASIEKGEMILGYKPEYSVKKGLDEANKQHLLESIAQEPHIKFTPEEFKEKISSYNLLH
jgi:hypothetical protein